MASQDSVKLPSSSLSHRLPTISASQALQKLKSQGPRAISTGLKRLDVLLRGQGNGSYIGDSTGGGLVRGQVTEVYGPPGVGKTTFGLQATVSALSANDHVVWVDAATQLTGPRLDEMLLASKPPDKDSAASPEASLQPLKDMQSRFHHYTTPTLAYLLALFVRPTAFFPPPGTSLVVLDSISTLFDNTYARNADDRSSNGKSDAARWAAGRKYAVLSELISKLGKMAAINNVAMLVTSQTVTRVRSGAGALLLPAISGTEWDSGIATRLVLFRDWPPVQGKPSKAEQEGLRRIRFVGVVKAGGVGSSGDGQVGTVVPFTIESTGLSPLVLSSSEILSRPPSSPLRPAKRGLAEVADPDGEDAPGSDEEEYSWIDDEALAAEGLIVDEATLMQEQELGAPRGDELQGRVAVDDV